MKKIVFMMALAVASTTARSQTSINDTVVTGAGYANDIWYSLQNDNQGISPRANWDLAFEANGYTTAILINSANGVELYQTNLGAADFTTVINPSIVSSLPKRYNTDTSWAYGAFNLPSTSAYDLGWGVYNPSTHIVSGDSVYVIKLADGSYKKLIIDNLNGGVYTFRYDDLSGTGAGTTASITKATYSTKNFGYYSIQNTTAIDREPATANWDLLFTKYTAFIPSAYGVTGVLQNKGVLIQQADDVANPATSVPSSAMYQSAINTIGYDWKSYNMSANAYNLVNDTVYFVKDKSGNIWRLRFNGFEGSGTGKYMFSKTLLSTSTGIYNVNQENIASMALYPNPGNGQDVTLIFSTTISAPVSAAAIYSMDGKLVKEISLESTHENQLNQVHISTNEFSNGIYMVRLTVANSSITQKLIINH